MSEGFKCHSFSTESASSDTAGKETIFMAIPNMRWVASSLAASMVSLERASHDIKSRYRFSFCWVEGVRPVDFARNVLVQMFLRSDATRIWFMDSDTMPPRAFTNLLLTDSDIVSGVTPTWGNNHTKEEPWPSFTVYRYDEKEKAFHHSLYYDSGIEDVDGVGTAMMLIKRHVIEDRRLWLPREYVCFDGKDAILPEDDPPPLFREVRKPNGQLDMTEDLDFCLRARKLGYRVTVNHEIKCGHWKEVDVLKVIHYIIKRLKAPDRLEQETAATTEGALG